MDDLNVVDMVFMHGYDNPTIGLICKVHQFFFVMIQENIIKNMRILNRNQTPS